MRFSIFILFFSTIIVTSAQVKFDAKATGEHAEAIDKVKASREVAKDRREQTKKLRMQVKARKLYKQKYDSAKHSRLTTLQSVDTDTVSLVGDSLTIKVFGKEDSLAIAEEILASADFPPEYKERILNPIENRDFNNKEKRDSLALVEAVAILEDQAKRYMPDELGVGSDPLTNFEKPVNEISTFRPPSKPNPNLIKPQKAKELFKDIDPKQFQKAQSEMQKLKRKYKKIPDTRYPKEGTKRNSLEDKPFKNRIYFGGNISAQSTDPLIGAVNLQLGYWINKKWLGGVGITLREQFTKEDSIPKINGDGYGYSLFTRYNVPKGFFAWVEVERQARGSLFSSENQVTSQWQSAYLAGIGKEFKVGFVQMLSMILYDFNYKQNDINAKPLVFKVGVRFTK